MTLISDKAHCKKLKEYNINIKTKYICGKDILETNTDDSYDDDIQSGVICLKEYYVGNELKHTEKIFDTRIEYSFISQKEENADYKCVNCGMEGKVKEFENGCPFCRTAYNVDYVNKNLGGKYHYDLVLKKPTYRIVTGIIDLIISCILSFFFIKYTSRTFNAYDISKIFIYGFILALILYYFFYVIDGYVIIGPVRRIKERENERQRSFWERTKIDKRTFFNNLNFEIKNSYYKESNIVDYDILDFIDFKEYKKKNTLYVRVTAEVRIVRFINRKFVSKYETVEYTLKRINDNPLELKEGINYIKCPHCGASIVATHTTCDYCRSDTRYMQEWVMEK